MTELFGTATIQEFYGGSFWRGASSVFDLWGRTGRFYRFAKTADYANYMALKNNVDVTNTAIE